MRAGCRTKLGRRRRAFVRRVAGSGRTATPGPPYFPHDWEVTHMRQSVGQLGKIPQSVGRQLRKITHLPRRRRWCALRCWPI